MYLFGKLNFRLDPKIAQTLLSDESNNRTKKTYPSKMAKRHPITSTPAAVLATWAQSTASDPR